MLHVPHGPPRTWSSFSSIASNSLNAGRSPSESESSTVSFDFGRGFVFLVLGGEAGGRADMTFLTLGRGLGRGGSIARRSWRSVSLSGTSSSWILAFDLLDFLLLIGSLGALLPSSLPFFDPDDLELDGTGALVIDVDGFELDAFAVDAGILEVDADGFAICASSSDCSSPRPGSPPVRMLASPRNPVSSSTARIASTYFRISQSS